MNMFNSTRLKLLAAGVLSAGVIVGCGSDKKADGNAPQTIMASITAAQGALVGADCLVTTIANGTRSFKTGPDGRVDFTIVTVPSEYPLVVTCTGGSYVDEANPSAGLIANNDILRSIMPDAATFALVGNNWAVTPFTEFAVSLYKSITPASCQRVETLSLSLKEIADRIAPGLYESASGLDFLAGPTPVVTGDEDLSAGTPADIYAAYLAGLALVASERSPAISPAALAQEVSAAIAGGTAIPQDVVDNLFNRAQAYMTGKGAKGHPLTAPSTAPTGGAATKPTIAGCAGGTGGTGGTGGGGSGGSGGSGAGTGGAGASGG
ncbi:hypothetical protein [Zhongshania arctica]|uniref:Uncharacterized protein n=1 Tax=Zhongshania arctica TaxID=3238302 RepID=A0ABV3TYX7_9GAMM